MFKQMKVGTRLITSFLIVSIMGAIVAGLGIYHMAQMNKQAELMYQRELLGVSHIKDANINLVYVARAVRNVLLAANEDQRRSAQADVQNSLSMLEANLDKSRGLFWSAKGKTLLAEVDAGLADYKRVVDELIRQASAEQLQAERASVQFMFASVVPKASLLDVKMTEAARLKVQNAAELAESTERQYADGRLLMVVLVVGGMAAGVAIGVLITRQLTRQLGGEPGDAADVAERIANGDLGVAVHLRDGDTSSILHAIKKMRDSLAGIVLEVRSGTDAIATSAGEVAAGSQDLSSRTEQQAASLEETASAMEQLTSTVRQNADNANQASTLAVAASQTAKHGGQVVSEVVTTMGAINDAAHKIVDIIAVIDGIAFQTNILALNAAVEAARAGEQGRGFAVVASEVRSLAQRSANAAREIKALIDDSVDKVEAGSALVDQAGATMQEVVASVQRVSDIVNEITAASREQTDGIEQINLSVTQMDEVTQQNAALVEEAAAASDSLKQQAGRLAELVSFFKASGGTAGPAQAQVQSKAKAKAKANAKAEPVVHQPAPARARPVARPALAAVRSPMVAPVTKRPVMARQAAATADSDWEEF